MSIKNLDPEILRFYNSGNITEVSQKGYYFEKVNFYISQLKKLNNQSSKILDIACNDGELSQKFLPFGEVVGIDINRNSIKIARKRGIKSFQTDIYGLGSHYNDYFDVIIAGDIIEHVFDTDSFLRKIHSLLKKNGILLLTTANLASFGRRLMLLLGKNPFVEYSTELPYKDFNVGHIRYYTAFDMKLQLINCRFRDIEIFGDRINILPGLSIPQRIAKHLPNISRNMHVIAKK